MEKIVRKIELKALNVQVENENYWSVILQATVSGDGNIAIVDKEVVFKADGKEIAKVRTNEFGEAITEPLLFLFELDKVDFIAQISGYVLNSFVLVYTPAPLEVDLAIDKKLIAVYADKKQVWDVVIKAAYQNKSVPDLKIVFVKGNEVFSEVTDKSGQIKKQLELYPGEIFVIRALKRQNKQEITYLELPEADVKVTEDDFYVDDNGGQVTKVCVVVKRGDYSVVEQWVLFRKEGNASFSVNRFSLRDIENIVALEVWVKTDKDGCARKSFSIIDRSGRLHVFVNCKLCSTLSYCNLDVSMNVVGFEVKDGGKQENKVEVFVKKEGRPVAGQEVDIRLGSLQTITKKTDKDGCIKDSYTLYGPNGGRVEIGLKGEKPECFISYCKPVLKLDFKTASRGDLWSGGNDRRYFDLSGVLKVLGPCGNIFLRGFFVTVHLKFYYGFLPGRDELEDEIIQQGKTDQVGFVKFERSEYAHYKPIQPGISRNLMRVFLEGNAEGFLKFGEYDISSNFKTKTPWCGKDFTLDVTLNS